MKHFIVLNNKLIHFKIILMFMFLGGYHIDAEFSADTAQNSCAQAILLSHIAETTSWSHLPWLIFIFLICV